MDPRNHQSPVPGCCVAGVILGASIGITVIAELTISPESEGDVGGPLGLLIAIPVLVGGLAFIGLVVGLIGGMVLHAILQSRAAAASKDD